MKKSFTLVLILFVAFSINARAQSSLAFNEKPENANLNVSNSNEDIIDTSASTLHPEDHRLDEMFGFKAGLNSSNVYNDVPGFKTQPVIGWAVGAFLTLPISKLFGFQPEFIYGQKGFKVKGTVFGDENSFMRKSIYLDFPLLFQVKPTKCVSLFAGPLVSFLIHSKDTYDDALITSEQKMQVANGTINPNVLGAEAGVDIYIQKFVGSLRAGLDLHALNGKATSNPQPYENSWIQLSIGYNLF